MQSQTSRNIRHTTRVTSRAVMGNHHFLSTVVTNASQYGKGGGLVASGAGLATITAAPKGSGVAEHGNLFDARSSFPTPKRTENILCLRACLRGGCVPAQGSLFPNPPLRSRFGWGCLAQRLRLEAYPWPARSTECTQDCIERGDMNLLCERGRVGANAREGGISERLHAKRKRR